MNKPFSPSCENNKDPILAVLLSALAGASQVLEIASGTGQHACYFAQHLPHLRWQPSDVASCLDGIRSWIDEYPGENLLAPLALDVCDVPWTIGVPDAVFSANSLHIMSWQAVQLLFGQLGKLAPEGSHLCIYGPFNYAGQYTSDSNARFDEWLAQQYPEAAIRDFEAVDELAAAAGYRLQQDHPMPANNRLLHWVRQASA